MARANEHQLSVRRASFKQAIRTVRAKLLQLLGEVRATHKTDYDMLAQFSEEFEHIVRNLLHGWHSLGAHTRYKQTKTTIGIPDVRP